MLTGEAAADTCEKRDSAQLYYNLVCPSHCVFHLIPPYCDTHLTQVVQDILDSERTYVHDITVSGSGPERGGGDEMVVFLQTLLSTYLVPLKTANM